MKQLVLLMVPIFFLLVPLCQAQTEIRRLLTVDLAYSLTGFLNQGWGIGLSHEEKLLDYLSVKGTFGHMTFLTGIKDVYCTSANISLFANYYPLGEGLDKLYLSAGSGCDFMNYFGGGELSKNEKDTLINVTPKIGWKLQVMDFLMIDISAGYKFIIVDAENYRAIRDYVNAGLQFGIGVKILLGRRNRENRHEENN